MREREKPENVDTKLLQEWTTYRDTAYLKILFLMICEMFVTIQFWQRETIDKKLKIKTFVRYWDWEVHSYLQKNMKNYSLKKGSQFMLNCSRNGNKRFFHFPLKYRKKGPKTSFLRNKNNMVRCGLSIFNSMRR